MIEMKDGKYKARPTCWGFGVTKSDKEQFTIEFAVCRGKDDHVTMIKNIQLGTEKGPEVLEKTLRICGWDGVSFGDVALDTEKTVEVVIENDPTYGAQIKFVNAGGIKFGMPADREAELIARLNKTLKPSVARPGATPPRITPPRSAVAQARPPEWDDALTPPGDDSDIPF